MIIWGGDSSGSRVNDGARFNNSANTWSALTTTGAPGPRQTHTAVWTGTEMIIWGGMDADQNTVYNTGGRYNPALQYLAFHHQQRSPFGPRPPHCGVDRGIKW